ncbi:MAG: ParB/RepB/Spo0J family partition protein [Planctomycetota bacterium]
MVMVPVGTLVANPHQPRTDIDQSDLTELSQSIKESGVLQPILARRVGGSLQIVAGERRWRAAKLAGLDEVPVLVRATTDQESAVFALVENLQREDLNAIEKAKAFRQLQAQLGAKQEEVAQRVGLDRSTVANFMRLLELAPEVQQHVSRGTLSMGHARALLSIKDPKLQTKLADEVIRQSLSVRALEELARQHAVGLPAAALPKKRSAEQVKAAWLKEIEETLMETFSTNVKVKYGRKSSVIEITCAGREEFERIYARLKES